ncbi:GHKL domain-containing protein [Ruminococcus flavefaciens]|uniref:GHKL domain-containing protein n=1 Tax=Ruminococcus flavefaciens TaxID=1265 RepID=A0A1H6ISP4_RUMFL|nr:GHKL domain-containing protein [Ruminococcus flavefaciens]
MMFLLQAATMLAYFIYSFVLYDKIYVSKKTPFLLKILCAVGLSLIAAYIKRYELPIVNLAVTFLSMILLTLLFYKPAGKSFLIYDTFILVIMLIVEMITAFIISLITGVSLSVLSHQVPGYAATAIMDWIIMLALAKSFVSIDPEKGINNVRTQEVIMFFGLIIGEMLLLNFLVEIIDLTKTGYEIVIILLLFLLLDLYLTYLINRISKAYKTEKELELLTQQSTLQLNAYNKLNEKYIASRKVIHDVRKHIASLEGLINTNKADEAGKYRDMLNIELNKLMPRFECENAILTVVINNKLETADNMKVDFKVNAEYTEVNFISNLDITAIFSNLLDNAFEACAELPEEKRHVTLSIARRNYFVFIYVENTFAKVNQDVKKRYRSTKKGHQGIGMSNIKSACEKYNGNFNAHTENDMFITEILIPIPETKPSNNMKQKEHINI